MVKFDPAKEYKKATARLQDHTCQCDDCRADRAFIKVYLRDLGLTLCGLSYD